MCTSPGIQKVKTPDAAIDLLDRTMAAIKMLDSFLKMNLQNGKNMIYILNKEYLDKKRLTGRISLHYRLLEQN